MSGRFSAEVREIDELLGRTAPFSGLDDELRRFVSRRIVVEYHRTDAALLRIGEHNDHVLLIVTGAIEVRSPVGKLIGRLGEGDLAGILSAVTGQPVRNQATAIEDVLVYRIDGETLREVRHQDPAFDHHLVGLIEWRLSPAARATATAALAVSSLIADCRRLVRRPPVSVVPGTSIAEAARLMTAERVSSLLVGTPNDLQGIVTDRDLRTRVVAQELDSATPVADVMTSNPTSISVGRSAHDALMMMTDHGIHHLPVLDGGEVIGLITSTDLLMARSNDPVHLAARIGRAATPDSIAEATGRVPRLVSALMAADALAEVVGRFVSSITDAATRRLCQLAEAELGLPPLPYAFVAFGSQGRREQTSLTDQDNGMILAEPVSGAAADYFAHLAAFVCDGLDAAGYTYCDGEVMASTPRWRVPIDEWAGYVASWVESPSPEAVMNSSIFFDARHVYGDEMLTDRFLAVIRTMSQRSRPFLGQMAANGAQFTPPLGFFRRFVVSSDGAEKDRFDLKAHGVIPVIELARVYALEAGVDAVNTFDRLRAVGASASMAPTDADELLAAFEHVAYVRLQHQRRQLDAGLPPDNFLDPTHLTRFEREQLRHAFVAIDRHQGAMKRHFETADMA